MAEVGFYGRYFKFARAVIRFFKPPKTVLDLSALESPTVYVGHHQNMRGPVSTMLWFPGQLHVWILHVFENFGSCYRHFIEFTFTKRKGYPKILSMIIAVPLALMFSALVRSAQGIPVHRGSTKIRETMARSIEALKRGEDIVIFPDIDYSNSGEDIGDIYTGFLQLEKIYYKNTDEHVRFVPLAVDTKNRRLITGSEVRFTDGESFREGKDRVTEEIRRQLSELYDGESQAM